MRVATKSGPAARALGRAARGLAVAVALAAGCGDSSAPVFPGVQTARLARGGTRLEVAWLGATDDRTAPQAIRYRVIAELERYGDPVVFEREVVGATSLAVPRPPALPPDRAVRIRVVAVDEAGNQTEQRAPRPIEPAASAREHGKGARIVGAGPGWAIVAAADGSLAVQRAGEARALPALPDGARAVAACRHPEGRVVVAVAGGGAFAEAGETWTPLERLPAGLVVLACATDTIAAMVREPAADHGALLWLDGGVWRDGWQLPDEADAGTRSLAAAGLAVLASGRAVAVASGAVYELASRGAVLARHGLELDVPLQLATVGNGLAMAPAASMCPARLELLTGGALRRVSLAEGKPGDWCSRQPLRALASSRDGVFYFASSAQLIAHDGDGFVEVWSQPIVTLAALPAGRLLIETPDGVVELRWPD